LKVVQGHRCWYPGKVVSSACYDKQQLSLCLSATCLVREESPYPVARNLLRRN